MTSNANQTFREGHSLAQEHYGRGHYIPEMNPHAKDTLPHVDWSEGYEDGWKSAFYAKRAPQQQPTLFQNHQK
jgi:hypothetical protein